MEEWEQEADASENSNQESEYPWQGLSNKEVFARVTHESSDERESKCGPCWSCDAGFSTCLVVCNPVFLFPPALMACDDDLSNVPVSPLPATSSNFGSPDGFGPFFRTISDAVGLVTSRITDVEQIGSTVSAKMVSSTESGTEGQLALSLHACARSKRMQPLLQAFLARQGRGPHRDRLMASQPHGPMTQGPPKRARTQDSDSIHS